MEFNEFLKEMDDKSDLNFAGVFDILEETNITIENSELNEALGLATLYGLHIDISKMKERYIPEQLILFIILHEIAHYKRMLKFGKQYYLNLLSRTDFESFFDSVIEEEVFADRWASLMYYKLNGKVYPKFMTQQLDKPEVQKKYRHNASKLFGVVDNDEENYKKLIKIVLK